MVALSLRMYVGAGTSSHACAVDKARNPVTPPFAAASAAASAPVSKCTRCSGNALDTTHRSPTRTKYAMTMLPTVRSAATDAAYSPVPLSESGFLSAAACTATTSTPPRAAGGDGVPACAHPPLAAAVNVTAPPAPLRPCGRGCPPPSLVGVNFSIANTVP